MSYEIGYTIETSKHKLIHYTLILKVQNIPLALFFLNFINIKPYLWMCS